MNKYHKTCNSPMSLLMCVCVYMHVWAWYICVMYVHVCISVLVWAQRPEVDIEMSSVTPHLFLWGWLATTKSQQSSCLSTPSHLSDRCTWDHIQSVVWVTGSRSSPHAFVVSALVCWTIFLLPCYLLCHCVLDMVSLPAVAFGVSISIHRCTQWFCIHSYICIHCQLLQNCDNTLLSWNLLALQTTFVGLMPCQFIRNITSHCHSFGWLLAWVGSKPPSSPLMNDVSMFF